MKIEQRKSINGITLIALVVTIVVLLILAGISISMLAGENGIIVKAAESRTEQRAGAVEERRDLWVSEVKSSKLTNTEAKDLDSILDELLNEKLLTEEEVQII